MTHMESTKERATQFSEDAGATLSVVESIEFVSTRMDQARAIGFLLATASANTGREGTEAMPDFTLINAAYALKALLDEAEDVLRGRGVYFPPASILNRTSEHA